MTPSAGGSRATRQPWKRILAWLMDWAIVLGWVAITASVGVPLYLAGVTHGVSILTLNVVGALVIVVPITVAFAVLDAGPRQGTIGKRALGLRVVDVRTGHPISFGRALERNALKIALPWLIGHSAVFAIVNANPNATIPPGVWALTAAAYVLPIVYIVFLFVGSGRPPYDRVGRMTVVGSE